jgi:hypothetical protein
MNMSGRVGKAETVLFADKAHAVPCTWHALGELDPREPKDPADIVVGGCHECGEPIHYNAAGTTPRERELSAELFGVGSNRATLTASCRSWAGGIWLSRRGPRMTAGTGEAWKQALIDENTRRNGEAWAKHLETISDEELECIGSEDFRELSDAELEAIIWPGPVKSRRAKC